MICKHCKTELPDGAKFCLGCGKPAPQPKQVQQVKQIPPILTVNEAAELLKISRWKIYDLLKNNEIPFFTVGQRKRFVTNQLLEWAGGKA